MYDGTVANAKELDAIRHEVENLKRRRSDREDELLAIARAARGGRATAKEAEEAATDRRVRVDHVVADAGEELAEVQTELRQRRADRSDLATEIDPELLELYEELRRPQEGRRRGGDDRRGVPGMPRAALVGGARPRQAFGRASRGATTAAASSSCDPRRRPHRRRRPRQPRPRGYRRGLTADDGEVWPRRGGDRRRDEQRRGVPGRHRGPPRGRRPRRRRGRAEGRQPAADRAAPREVPGQEPDAAGAARAGPRADAARFTKVRLGARAAGAEQGRRQGGERGRRRMADVEHRAEPDGPDPSTLGVVAPRRVFYPRWTEEPAGRPRRSNSVRRGKSGLRRAGCWVTPRRGDPRKVPQRTDRLGAGPGSARGGKGATVR